jgi:hypothetical protein
MRHILCAAALLVAVVLSASARAETVVLADGSALQGKVSTLNGLVTIETAEATLTLPAGKILRVVGAADAVPAKTRAVAPKPAAPAVAAPGSAPAPTPLARALASKIDVNFAGASPVDVFDYLRNVAKINVVLANDVRADTRPITLTLHGVSLADVLAVLSETNGYSYRQEPDQVLFVGGKSGPATYVMRMYDVTDLLLSREDTGAGPGGGGVFGLSSSSNTGLSGGGSNLGSSNGGVSPQYAPFSAGAPTIRGTAPASGVQAVRAQDLASVIATTCGRGSWAHVGAVAP